MDILIVLREQLQALSKFHQIEVFRLLQKQKVDYTENRNGIFVNMNSLDNECILELQEYIKYVSTQQDHLEVIEKKKEEYANSFFKNNKEMTST